MSQHWLHLPERGTAFTLRLITGIGLRLGPVGPWLARLLLYPITAYYVLTIAPAVRRASHQYLQRVLAQQTHWWHTARHFHCYASMILDRVFLLSGRHQHFQLNIHNGALLRERLAARQGCILLGAHLGSFEALRAIGASEQLKVKVLMNIDHNEKMTQLMQSLNPTMAQDIIALGQPDALLKAQESLEQGYLIGMLADRVFNQDSTVSCRFLDGSARFPAGPMRLAVALRCPVFLAFGILRSSGQYDIYFEHFAERIECDRQQREQDLQRWTQRYAERLEYYTRHAPYNWFNFYDYWENNAT